MKILGTVLVLVTLMLTLAVWYWQHRSTRAKSSPSGDSRDGKNPVSSGDAITTGIALHGAAIPDPRSSARKLALARLQALMEERNDYQVFVVVREDGKRGWRAVKQLREGKLVLEEGTLDIDEVRGFVVAYSNGEILNRYAAFSPFPGNLHFFEESKSQRWDVLDPRTLLEGRKYIRITFGSAVAHRNESGHYSTTLTNLTDEKIRVVRFGAYGRGRFGIYRFDTVSGDYFTAQEFRDWYGVDADGWIHPGQSVTDGNNYGEGDSYWVYECVTESGAEFAAGERIVK